MQCLAVFLLLIRQAAPSVACEGGDGDIDCDVGSLHVSLLQMEEASIVLADRIAVVERRSERAMPPHTHTNFSKQALQHRQRNTTRLTLIASSLHTEHVYRSMLQVLPRMTLFNGVALVVVSLSLLTYTPHLIRTVW